MSVNEKRKYDGKGEKMRAISELRRCKEVWVDVSLRVSEKKIYACKFDNRREGKLGAILMLHKDNNNKWFFADHYTAGVPDQLKYDSAYLAVYETVLFTTVFEFETIEEFYKWAIETSEGWAKIDGA